jgi:t-SNARE complex subunit (syntaxin)
MTQVSIPETRLVRDIHSKALLNTDRRALDEYHMKREIAKKQQSEVSETKQKIEQIEQEMAEIKNLLKDIVSLRKV